ncbi:hypothetical protein [Pseudomonas helleri]|uniref:hypothetical protein n=1 Tax=Pseudomonas helleri TaxID=1608996 RepID=UPI003A0FD950
MTDLNGGALFNAEFGIRHRGSTVPERSGVALSFCRRPLIDIDGGSGIKIIGITSIDDNKSFINYLVRFSNASYGEYPVNVLIDEYISEGGKALGAGSVVAGLRVIKNGVHSFNGARLDGVRVQLPVLISPPENPCVGEEFNADGILWSPVDGGRARVIYSGAGVYTKLINF